jgi:aerobic-type carbon monoxide dehydrogenase small subunit (CoxS/CutS family)
MAEDKEKEEFGKISRREFLKDAGLVVGGATIGSVSLLNACGGGTVTETSTTTKTVTATGGSTKTTTVTVTSPPITQVGETSPATPAISLTGNGQGFGLAVNPTDTLRDVLREQLNLISIKDMCSGYGACGSCTIIMNARPVLSCMTFACECDGAVIETAEGIAAAKNPLIDAYIVNQCMQCGYCTPGFLVTAKALIDRKPNPTEEDIREILGGNICRCGTYPAHIRAVIEATSK